MLLIYPQVSSFFVENQTMLYGLAPPLGLLYLASVLEKKGIDVKILDFSAEPYAVDRLHQHLDDVDVIGISVLTPAVGMVQQMVKDIREYDKTIPVIVGGAHCSLFPEESLSVLDADVCVISDGEPIIGALVDALVSQKSLVDIPGILFKKNKDYIRTAEPVFITDLDSFLFPARHLVNHYVYGKGYNPRFKAGDFTTIMLSRGCPFHCTFCSRRRIGFQTVRRRSVDNILAEFEVIKNLGFTHVAIKDDCFPLVKNEAMQILDGIIAKKFDFKIYVTASRVSLLDDELLRKMRDASVVHIQFGLESGSQKILDLYKKQTTLDSIRHVVKKSHDFGIFTAGTFIVGAPQESMKDVKETILFALKLPLNSVSFLPLRYMAGSELWEKAVAEGHIDGSNYIVGADKQFKLSEFSYGELVNISNAAQLRYYFRLKFLYILFKTMVKQNNPGLLRSYLPQQN